MNDSTTNEISNLFQELIVSKIKDEIDDLKKKVEELDDHCNECKDIIPKSSFIKQQITSGENEVINHLDEIVRNSKTELFLKQIDAYLNKQYAFDESVTLCTYLDNLEKGTTSKLDSLIDGQGSFIDKYNAVTLIIEQFKNDILVKIKDNSEILNRLEQRLELSKAYEDNSREKTEAILEKHESEIAILNNLVSEAGNISKNTIQNDNKIEEVKSIMNVVLSNVAYENKGEGKSSIKSDFVSITNRLDTITEQVDNHIERLNNVIEVFETKVKKQDVMMKILLAGNIVSLIGIIAILIAQFM